MKEKYIYSERSLFTFPSVAYKLIIFSNPFYFREKDLSKTGKKNFVFSSIKLSRNLLKTDNDKKRKH